MAIVSLLAQIVVLRHTFIVLFTITALVRGVFVVGALRTLPYVLVSSTRHRHGNVVEILLCHFLHLQASVLLPWSRTTYD